MFQAQILAGQRLGRAPMKYDFLYSTFRPAAQTRNRLGHKLWRGHCASMPRLREDLHIAAVAFFSLHELQPAGSLSGMMAARFGALLWGSGNAYA